MPTYFESGKIIDKVGEVSLYDFDGELYLDISGQLWMSSHEREEVERQISNKPKGDCLELGLGLGIASYIIIRQGSVKSLTTVEINKDVIDLYYKSMEGLLWPNHKIVQGNCLDYLVMVGQTKKRFDFVFIDFYSIIDEDTLPDIEASIRLSKKILNTNGEVVAWFDTSTPDENAERFWNAIKRI